MTFALLASLCVGLFGRGYWTPDEPREADIAWRMSWQSDKAVPLLAGEAFCEKPPLTYWAAGAAIAALGTDGWVARLPNLLYALASVLCVGLLGRRCAGPLAGLVAAAAIGTFLLSFQVAIWLATDAALVAAVAAALLGLHVGFYAADRSGRMRGYCGMHLALACGFLTKSAAGWMVPILALVTLIIWERRWRELLRWELYAGLPLQAVIILAWVWMVYLSPDGPAHLKVFFWNNLAGRFAHIDAPADLQYTAGHRNSPGKYLIELPLYLLPWTLLVATAVRRAWKHRASTNNVLRFALAVFLPTLAVLSVAATARNIYLAPALPGIALLLGWWAREAAGACEPWDGRAVRATAALLLAAVALFGVVSWLVGTDAAGTRSASRVGFFALSLPGLALGAACALGAWRAMRRDELAAALLALLLGYAALLTGPAAQIYRRVDAWQDLASIGRAVAQDAAGRPLVLIAPDETTRAFVDMHTRTAEVAVLESPIDAAATARLQRMLATAPRTRFLVLLPGREDTPVVARLRARLGKTPEGPSIPAWTEAAHLAVVQRYALPNGRRYALLEAGSAKTSR